MFGSRLREVRLEHGYTLKQVAEGIGVTLRAVCNYELGDREPSFEILIKICRFFDVSADYLLGLTNY